MDEISECGGVLIRIRRIGIEKAAAVLTAFRIGPLFPVYFTGLSPISILYAAIGTLSARYRTKAMGPVSRQQSTADLERANDMAQIESMESEDPCEPPLRPQSRSSLFFIGTDRHGNWVVRDQVGLCGGLFVNRSEALRFAMLENGHRPQAVMIVPGILEFSVDGPAKAAGNDSTGVAKTNRRVLASSRSPHTADRISKSLC